MPFALSFPPASTRPSPLPSRPVSPPSPLGPFPVPHPRPPRVTSSPLPCPAPLPPPLPAAPWPFPCPFPLFSPSAPLPPLPSTPGRRYPAPATSFGGCQPARPPSLWRLVPHSGPAWTCRTIRRCSCGSVTLAAGMRPGGGPRAPVASRYPSSGKGARGAGGALGGHGFERPSWVWLGCVREWYLAPSLLFFLAAAAPRGRPGEASEPARSRSHVLVRRRGLRPGWPGQRPWPARARGPAPHCRARRLGLLHRRLAWGYDLRSALHLPLCRGFPLAARRHGGAGVGSAVKAVVPRGGAIGVRHPGNAVRHMQCGWCVLPGRVPRAVPPTA